MLFRSKLLRALIQPPDAPPIFLVMGMRTPAESAEAEAQVDRFCAQLPVAVPRLGLAPLPPEAAGELVRERLAVGEAEPREDSEPVRVIVRESAGHPLFIHELVRHLRSRPQGGLSGELRLDDVLWERIRALEDASRHLVELVSVSFGPLRQSQAAQALGLNPAEVFRLAARLKILHLVRTSGPRDLDLLAPYHEPLR